MKQFTFAKKILSLFLSLLIAGGTLAAVTGQAYAVSHPAAVNADKSQQQISAEDEAQFAAREGFDYHEADEGDYAPNELILEITSSPAQTTASLHSFESQYNLTLERVLSTTPLEEESMATTDSLGNEETVITTYFMSTGEDDIISLCDALNQEDSVFNAQPNFRYDICEEEETSAPLEESTAPQTGEQTDDMQDTSAPVAPEQTPLQADAYTEPPAFGTTEYNNNLKWWFDYCEISSGWATYADSSTGYGMGKGVTVAVIDTGCNTAHEDIKDNLWKGSSNQCGYYAYGKSNIYANDKTNDVNSHGSHCCGTIAMSGNNTVGGIGTAPKCSLMVMKADRNTGKGSFYDSELITSLNKAKEFGADIISMSLGGYNYSYATYRTYQSVSSSCLIVCAAGNDSFDTTEKLHYPSAASCVMGVMAMANSSNRSKLATFSNYDTTGNFYKVAAPGTNIYSIAGVIKDSDGNPTSYPTDQYCNKNGTSMATPAAAGMIASFMSYIRGVKGWDWTPAQYQYEVEYLINYSGNSISCSAYSQSYHPIAYKKDSTFKVMNLKYLLSRMSTLSSNPFASTSSVSFSNSTILDGIKNATGLTASEIDTYALKRVGLLYWSLASTRKGISDYSDLSKITGLNYLDLSGSSKITQNNIADVISKCPASLFYLDLTTNAQLSDLSCLASAKFPCLYYLNISSNNLSTISPIEKFTSLKELYANSNAIVDISPLAGMTHMEHLELNNNKIEDPNPAFASDFLNYIDLSHNCLIDHNQLFNYKGAYHSSGFHSDSITFKVDYNNMTELTTAVANNIKSTITANNTKGDTLYATTINFTYSNQTASTSSTPMTSFKISDKTVSREVLCSGNLNMNDITGFTAYPSSANRYKYLNWTCSEGGYIASDGTVLVSPEQITSCRTLTLTGTAPEASGATSTVTHEASQTIKLTITAPEIYNAYLSDHVLEKNSVCGIIVATNQYTDKVYLKFSKSGSDDILITGSMGDTPTANGTTKIKMFIVPNSVVGTEGNYSCYVYAADAGGNYSTKSNDDITGKSTYPYKYLGYLYVKDSVTYATDSLNVTYDQKVNRYGQSALFAVNSGTYSTSPAKPTGNYGLSTYVSQRKYIGSGSYFGVYGAGYFGNEYDGYPSAQTAEASFFISNSSHSELGSIESKITTVAPEVNAVEIKNTSTYKNDGYVEYLVKTNTDATALKAYAVGTQDDIAADVNLLVTTFNSTPGTYANYNATYSHKLWSVKVPLNTSKAMQAVTLTAADPLGDGTVTKTPATGLRFNGAQYIYPGENNYEIMSNSLTVLPADENGNSLADCCKSVSYTANNADYFTVVSSYTGKISADMEKVLTDLEDTSTKYKYCTVTATLESGATATASLYAYRPDVSALSYDRETSSLTNGGTVYYSVKTYGADTIYIRDVSDKYSQPLFTLTKADTDAYTVHTDDKGNEYTVWTFERTFDTGVTTLRTYVRASYAFSNTLTASTSSYVSNTVTRTLESADYSEWDVQTARINDDELLATVLAAYGENTEAFDARLAACQQVVDNADLNCNETDQETVDTQTGELKTAIDALFGYDDYAQSMANCEAFLQSENAPYASAALESFILTELTDANTKALANGIDAELQRIDAMIAKIATIRTYISSLEENVPELLTGEDITLKYCAQTYEALEEYYQLTKQKIFLYTYETIEQVNEDEAMLQNAFEALQEHNFIHTEVSATCIEQGYTLHTCEICDMSYKTDFTPLAEHTPQTIPAVDPTCTENGFSEGIQCAVCEAVLVEPTEVPALGHDYGEWIVSVPATCTATGLEISTCSRDHTHTQTREIPMSEHNYVTQTVEPTCTEQGYTVYTCSACGDTYQSDITPAKGHTLIPIQMVEPTCTEDGYTAYLCSVCQYTCQDDITPAKGHTALEIPAVAPTCTEPGLTAGEQCAVCEAVLTEQTSIPAKGHTAVEIPAVEPTCTEPGSTAGEKCAVCQAILSEPTAVPEKGHTPVEIPAVEPTCTDPGSTAGEKCAVCQAILSEPTAIPEKGHTPVEIPAVEPTCTEPGLTAGEQCAVCEAILTAQTTVEALGHDYGEWQVTTPATCTATGVETRVCSRNAAHIQTHDIPMAEHRYTLHNALPEDQSSGYIYFVCEGCSQYFTAVYDGEKYAPDTVCPDEESAKKAVQLPAPAFNTFVSEGDEYHYEARGASLRLSESAAYDKDFETTQGLRFTASVKLPDGIDFDNENPNITVQNFGFVYSQTGRIQSDIDNLVLGGTDVYALDMQAKNSGAFNGTNWNGVTYHAADNTITFNMVVNVKAMNWEKDYCARSFITYVYNGYTFTVYDSAFSSRSVAYVALQVLQSDTETQEAKDFCKHKILDYI